MYRLWSYGPCILQKVTFENASMILCCLVHCCAFQRVLTDRLDVETTRYACKHQRLWSCLSLWLQTCLSRRNAIIGIRLVVNSISSMGHIITIWRSDTIQIDSRFTCAVGTRKHIVFKPTIPKT
mmetsp:Transcript_18812/g.31553  ORF Transcript_18812/g.31553 Transcript_18812/m.31553 type:complete len:124 (-) Transcript_18812:349-720(-)